MQTSLLVGAFHDSNKTNSSVKITSQVVSATENAIEIFLF